MQNSNDNQKSKSAIQEALGNLADLKANFARLSALVKEQEKQNQSLEKKEHR